MSDAASSPNSPVFLPDSSDDEPARPRGIQSVEVGGQLLKALARTGRRMALKDLAREAEMTAAKAHPYLVSFCKLGLMEQDRASGHYGLGPLAIQMGLISLQQADPVRLAIAELPALAQEVGSTVSIAMWSGQGPTIIRVEEGPPMSMWPCATARPHRCATRPRARSLRPLASPGALRPCWTRKATAWRSPPLQRSWPSSAPAA